MPPVTASNIGSSIENVLHSLQGIQAHSTQGQRQPSPHPVSSHHITQLTEILESPAFRDIDGSQRRQVLTLCRTIKETLDPTLSQSTVVAFERALRECESQSNGPAVSQHQVAAHGLARSPSHRQGSDVERVRREGTHYSTMIESVLTAEGSASRVQGAADPSPTTHSYGATGGPVASPVQSAQILCEQLTNPDRSTATVVSPTRYFSTVAVERAPVGTTHREWSINCAFMLHAASTLDAASEEAKVLREQALMYLSKFASLPTAEQMELATTPFQTNRPADYHRAAISPLHINVTQELARTLHVDPSTLFLVTDERIMEAIHRGLPHTDGGGAVVVWGEQSFDAILEHMDAAQRTFTFVDITPFLQQISASHQGDPESLKEALNIAYTLVDNAIKDELLARATKSVMGTPNPLTRPELLALEKNNPHQYAEILRAYDEMLGRAQRNIILGATSYFGDQCCLHARQLTHRDGEQGHLTPEARNKLREFTNHGGFSPGPADLYSTWLGIADPEEIMKALLKQDKVTAPQVIFPSDCALPTYNSFAALMATDTGNRFRQLAHDGDASPYIKGLATGLTALLDGLHNEHIHDRLVQRGQAHTLQFLSNRILAHMEHATQNTGNMLGFLNDAQLIYEDMTALVILASPYTPTDAYHIIASNARAEMIPTGFPESIHVDAQLRASGMRCLHSALTGCEDLKQAQSGTRALNVAVQSNAYYEGPSYVIDHARNFSTHTLATDALASSSAELSTQLGSKKLDVYVCEFHHNISADRQDYKKEDILAQVQNLYDRGLVSDTFTVAIDITIGATTDPAIKAFLAHFQDKIDAGQLNVVLYRSAQKFDQFGMDNCNGGILLSVNDNRRFQAFNASLAPGQDTISNRNTQILSHLQKYAATELNAYRQLIARNVAKLLGKEPAVSAHDGAPRSACSLPPEMVTTSTQSHMRGCMLQVADTQDDMTPFLDIKCPYLTPDSPAAVQFYKTMEMAFAARANDDPAHFPVGFRPSFGFSHSNVSLIGSNKLRFNPGLEDEVTLKNYRDFLVEMNDALTEAFHDIQTAYPHLQPELIASIATPTATSAKAANKADRLPVAIAHCRDVESRGGMLSKDEYMRLSQMYCGVNNPFGAERMLQRAEMAEEHAQQAIPTKQQKKERMAWEAQRNAQKAQIATIKSRLDGMLAP